MELKPKVLALLEYAYAEQAVLDQKLSDGEKSRIGEPDNWCAKDVVAHIAAWQERMAHNLTAGLSGSLPKPTEDYEIANQEIFEEHRERSWSDVLAYGGRVYQSLMATVQTLEESHLIDRQFFPWQDGRPLWQLVVGNGYTHPVFHLAAVYIELGDSAYATELQEGMVEALSSLDESPQWQGLLKYNLACHYSLMGRLGEAIDGLREALQLNPGLADWSREDPDIIPLRDHPDYLALYE